MTDQSSTETDRTIGTVNTDGRDTPMWEMVNLVKAYPGVLANDNVSLKLYAGTIHGLLGENGCGKSTFIKMVSGVQRPDYGLIINNGLPVVFHDPQDARAKGIATVFQEFSIVPTLSVAENIYLGRLPKTRRGFVDWDILASNAKSVLKEMEVDLDPMAITGDLSVAEQQLVEIAKAVAANASMVILDEPTAALGIDEIEQLHKLLRRMKANGCAILYISHRLDEVERIVDEVTILRNGKVIRKSGETEVNVEQIVAAMIGGAVTDHYPKQQNARPEPLFEVRDLAADSGIHDVSFSVNRGEIFGLGGVLGSGRTEIALALFGVHKPRRGEILLKGKPLRISSPKDAIRQGLALVSENRKFDGLFNNFAANGNITSASYDKITNYGFLDLNQEQKVTEQFIEELEISRQANEKSVGLLSGGNQQKVILARWLFSDADLYIFDEPTQGIDVGAKLAVYNLMNRITREGKSIILISSDHDELLALSDRIAIVQNSTIARISAATDLTHSDLVKAATGNPQNTSTAHIKESVA
ncbi:sugar ABC transporter ATP-binding protein [uncultured Cohaesibacter sp.]|uniref:sugar ABC transporter ATP-binding protein n=1 Tax=uncultured Cohaesibacter sp. TaxID=1002546 RepID=UPI0029C937E3|nr:sugar ABC transporter ATP-binding protein [uncultured Cohaesibacter sp.]